MFREKLFDGPSVNCAPVEYILEKLLPPFTEHFLIFSSQLYEVGRVDFVSAPQKKLKL